jgi:hypothetical protein
MHTEGAISILEPGRIKRILEKISNSHLPLSLVKKGEETLHIRGQAHALASMMWHGKTCIGLQINQISKNGMSLLVQDETIKIECPLVTSKLEFSSTICQIEKDSIWISCPLVISSIERRRNTRFNSSASVMGYARFSMEWEKKIDGYTLPCFPFYTGFESLLRIADISPSGMCVETSLPFSFYALKKYMQGKSFPLEAALLLPLQPELPIALFLRWVKKTRDSSGEANSMKQPKTTYRFGCEFVDSSGTGAESAILQFIQQISMADTI